MIKEIAFTAYPAADVSKLRDFYRDTLGLEFTGPYEQDGVLKYDEASIGNGYFSIMTTEWTETEPGTAASIVFEVDDVTKTKNELTSKGIETQDIYETPVCKLFSFKDPEGNKVTLHQITVPH